MNPPLRPATLPSPTAVLGAVLRPLPPRLLDPLLALAVALIRRRHPDVFERLAGLGDPVFLVAPDDLPLVFRLEAHDPTPRLCALRPEAAADVPATATIRGPLLRLIDLAEGRVDGDALFFAGDLSFEGETEAVVALRNALDDAEIDLIADGLAPLGPLAGPATRLVKAARDLAERVADRLAPPVPAPAGPRSAPAEAPPPETRPRRPVRRRRGTAREAGDA